VGDDILNGGVGNDHMNDGPGSDTLWGGTGNDVYRFNQDHGQDTIMEAEEADSNDRLVFVGGTVRNELWFHRDGNHLVITRLNSTDQVTIRGWYRYPDRQIERVIIPEDPPRAIERSRLLKADIQSLVDALAPFGPPIDGVVNLTAAQQQAVNSAIDAAWR
jgi:predicted DNA binding protein